MSGLSLMILDYYALQSDDGAVARQEMLRILVNKAKPALCKVETFTDYGYVFGFSWDYWFKKAE